MRKKKQKTLLIVFALLVIVILGVGTFYFYSQNKKLNQEVTTLNSKIDSNSKTVYVATKDIEPGEVISIDGDEPNVEQQPVLSGLDAYKYITDDDLGKKATIKIESGDPVMCTMVTDSEITADSRKLEMAAVELATNQADYDVVDVRILFPDGSDYIVLSKVEMTDIDMEQNIFTGVLNEEEILRYSCAVVDAYKHTGTKLYTTKYVESSLQDEATPTYPVSDVTRELVQSDPNITSIAETTLNASARLSLEERLGLVTEEQQQAIESNMTTEQGKRAAVVSNKINEQKEQESMDGIDMTDTSTDDASTDTTDTSDTSTAQ